MWTSSRRTRAAHPTRSRRVGVAVALLACVGLTGCRPQIFVSAKQLAGHVELFDVADT